MTTFDVFDEGELSPNCSRKFSVELQSSPATSIQTYVARIPLAELNTIIAH